MSFSDETQEYLLVRPPQSIKPGKRSAHNLQIQRLLPSSPRLATTTTTRAAERSPPRLPRPRILPILNLESHSIRKTRIVESEGGDSICKFDKEPRGVLGKWQVDLRRGNGGGWIFVGKYERYEWAKKSSKSSQGQGDEGEVWELVRSTYSHSKSLAEQKQQKPTRRTKSVLSENRTVRESMDDFSSPAERRLAVTITVMKNSPPSVVIIPRNPRAAIELGGTTSGGTTGDTLETTDEMVESVNKEEVINALIQGLWIVWREGVVEDINLGRRNTWTPGSDGERKRGVWDILLCRD